jgi:hypothetical protein
MPVQLTLMFCYPFVFSVFLRGAITMAHNEWCLRTGEKLETGQFLTSKNGLFHAVLQADGNFVVYRGDYGTLEPWPQPWPAGRKTTALWAVMPDDGVYSLPSERGGFRLDMQQDGNLVIYNLGASGKPFWALANAHQNVFGPNRWAVLYDDGNFTVGPNEKGDQADYDSMWRSRKFATDRTDGFDLDSLEITSIEYVSNGAKNTTIKDSQKFRGVEQELSNPNDTPTESTMSLSYTYSTKKTWGIAQKFSMKTTFKAQVPFVGETGVELLSETAFTFNKEEGESTTVGFTHKLTVPGHMKGSARAVWYISKLLLPFKAHGKIKFNNLPEKIPVHLEGEFKDGQTAKFGVEVSKFVPYEAPMRAVKPEELEWREVASIYPNK